jgi:transcription elongation factor GreB
LEAEREQLIAQKAALGDAVESKEKSRSLDRALEALTERLNAVHIVEVPPRNPDQVRFGATIVLSGSQGESQTWRIVGVDEVDLPKGWVSWISPLARVLLDKRVGDTVQYRQHTWTIQKIMYSLPV